MIKVIIPAYNEVLSIGKVLQDIPVWIAEVIVVNNASTDGTDKAAHQHGATVVHEPKPGYGNACLAGLAYIKQQKQKPDIVVFMDADFSDYGDDMEKLIQPIQEANFDFVVGARHKQLREPNSMTPQQIFGNKLATILMRIFYRSTFTDLGPYRAIKYNKLLLLNMSDKTYGWTVEMQLKAIRKNLAYAEVPVKYRNRIGESKISGTLSGTIKAGIKIIGWIIKFSFVK